MMSEEQKGSMVTLEGILESIEDHDMVPHPELVLAVGFLALAERLLAIEDHLGHIEKLLKAIDGDMPMAGKGY